MSGRRRGMDHEHGIELTPFNEPTIRRTRSGSFTGSINYIHEAKHAGYAEFGFSKSTGTFEVKTILSEVRGGGREMMSQMESLARKNEATSMETATSRPGFFKKVGFDYTPEQRAINERKYTPEELAQQEDNRGEEGGGFFMHKPLV